MSVFVTAQRNQAGARMAGDVKGGTSCWLGKVLQGSLHSICPHYFWLQAVLSGFHIHKTETGIICCKTLTTTVEYRADLFVYILSPWSKLPGGLHNMDPIMWLNLKSESRCQQDEEKKLCTSHTCTAREEKELSWQLQSLLIRRENITAELRWNCSPSSLYTSLVLQLNLINGIKGWILWIHSTNSNTKDHLSLSQQKVLCTVRKSHHLWNWSIGSSPW